MLYKVKEDDIDFFPNELKRRAQSSFDQNSNITISGQLGTGKSTTAISIAIKVAKGFAKDYDGDKDEWIKYFNPEKNWGIMSLKNVLKCYEEMSKCKMQVWLIDDFSPAMSGRTFMSGTNLDQTNLMVISRPNLHTIFYTFPQKALVDVNVRRLTNYEVHMRQPYFKYGYTSAKIFKIEPRSDDPKPIKKYLQDREGHGTKYLIHFFKKAEDLINSVPVMDIYKEKRLEAQKELEKQIIENLRKSEQIKETIVNTSKKEIYQEVYNKWMEGAFATLSLIEVCEQKGLNYKSLSNHIKEFKQNMKINRV